MPRPLQRACLQDGLKLDLNGMIRRGSLVRNGISRERHISWTSSYWGNVADGVMTADMSGERFGSFTIQIGVGRIERIALLAQPRRYGGRQWYFVCPRQNRLVSVLWRPTGANFFASRQAFGRSVAYRSQFLDRDSRAHHAQANLKRRLCELDKSLDPDEWDFPPRPKWMRQKTYERFEARYDGQDDILNTGIVAALANFERRWGKL